MTWFVIVNPSAGRRPGEAAKRAADALTSRSIDHRLVVSEGADHIAGLVSMAHAEGFSRFVSVGGDGTANLVVDALMQLDWPAPPTLAILPAGSGSDFIRTFALPKTIEGAVEHLVDDAAYPCDVAAVTGSFGTRHFLNAANIGVAAASVRFADRLPRRLGGARYAAGFWLALPRFPMSTVRVVADDRVYEGRAINVVVANGQFFGGGMNIAPRATVMDGRFDVQVFLGPRRQAFTVMPRVIRGTHLGHRGVRRFTASSIDITCPASWPVEMDGELVGSGSIHVDVRPAAIRFKI